MAGGSRSPSRADAARALTIAQAIDESARAAGLSAPPNTRGEGLPNTPNFDQVVDDDELRRTCRKLYLDGHYAQAVEEAYKCVNNVVKRLSGLGLDGVTLMQSAFSANNPVLALNSLQTSSELDQQRGYMEIFAAVITRIRNPRAHEHAYLDDPTTALELLGMANHLVRIARSATVVPRQKRTR
jgi:uncharacterized protein (TIGR02391 family)